MATPYQSKNLLKKYLDNLNDEDLREFKWRLSLNDREGHRPIPRSQLENKTRLETVDKLVQVYGAEGAVNVTVDTFIKMRQNDLVEQLSEERNIEQQFLSPARANQRDEDQTVASPMRGGRNDLESNQSQSHHFGPIYAAQSGGTVVAPPITNSSIGTINININSTVLLVSEIYTEDDLKLSPICTKDSWRAETVAGKVAAE